MHFLYHLGIKLHDNRQENYAHSMP